MTGKAPYKVRIHSAPAASQPARAANDSKGHKNRSHGKADRPLPIQLGDLRRAYGNGRGALIPAVRVTTRLAPGGPYADVDGTRAWITNRAHLDGDGPVAKRTVPRSADADATSAEGLSKTRVAEVQSRVQSGLLLSLSNTGFSIGHPPTISVDADAERVRTPVAD